MFNKPKVITLKMRFEYLKGLYETSYSASVSYEEFVEAVFAKLEEELRSAKSGLDNYVKQKIPTMNMTGEKFKYEYDK